MRRIKTASWCVSTLQGIPLGGFSLREFRAVYASLTASANEHLSFRWSLDDVILEGVLRPHRRRP